MFNLASCFLDRHLDEGRGASTAVRCGGVSFTYAGIAALANRAGNALRALGVEAGDRVLLLLPDSLEFVAAWFGAIKIGAVAVPTNTALRAADFAYFLQESQARVMVFAAALWPLVESILPAQAIVTGEPRPGCMFWDDWIAAHPAELDPAATSGDDPAFWLWTSGSTGAPKAAVHRHRDWIHCCEGYAGGVLGLAAGDITFSTSKLFHAYGLGNGLMFPFHAGATTVLYPGRPQARAMLEQVHAERPTLFFSVPTLYAAMLHETDAGNPYDFSSVRLAVSAAEPLPPDIYRRWRERFGCEILDGIGSTEVLHIYASARPGQVKPGSTGCAVPGYEIRIIDEKGRAMAPGEAGDLWVRGESTATCYWNRPQLTAERMVDGWFFSGDKFRAEEDGYLWYSGRSDDMFRVSGEWVSPVEVEAALIEHPAVLECAVVAYKDENQLVKPKACVVLKDAGGQGDELARELQQFVRARLAGYKYPRRIQFMAELPKTPTGKIQRYKLRE